VSERFFSCSIALLVAVTSATILWMGLGRLGLETRRSTLTLGVLELGDNHFALSSGGGKTPCFASITADLSDDNHHYSIHIKGWISLAFSGKHRLQEFAGQLSFNPLAQMGISLLEIPIGDDFVKIGTNNINPITVLVFGSSKDKKPIFQQDIPGPVEIRKEDHLFKIMSPLPVDAGLRSALTPMLTFMPLTIRRDDSHSCTKRNSRPLDLTALVNSVGILRSRISNTFPLGIP
jgi:hypothetical protein